MHLQILHVLQVPWLPPGISVVAMGQLGLGRRKTLPIYLDYI